MQNRRVWSILWNSLQCRRVWSPSHGACRGQIASINNSPGSHWILLRNFVCWVDQRSSITLGGVGLALEMEGQNLASPDQINAYFDCSYSRIRGGLLFKCHKPRHWFTRWDSTSGILRQCAFRLEPYILYLFISIPIHVVKLGYGPP